MAQAVEPDVTEDDVLQILTEPGHDRVAESPKAVTQLPIAQPAAQAPVPSGAFPGPRVPHIPKQRTSTLRRLAGLPLEWPKTSGALLAGPLLIALLIIAMTPSYEGLKVTGNVTLDGAPVVDATVTFYSANSGVGASSTLDESGQFEMKTHKGGLPPDNYAVYVYSPRSGAIPEHYSSLKTSGLPFDVSEHGSPIEIKLESD